eukprot:gene18576-40296_t
MSGPFAYQMPSMTSGPPDVENPTQGWGVAGTWMIQKNKKGVAKCGEPYVSSDHPDRCLYTVNVKVPFNNMVYGDQREGGEGWMKGMPHRPPRAPAAARARFEQRFEQRAARRGGVARRAAPLNRSASCAYFEGASCITEKGWRAL